MLKIKKKITQYKNYIYREYENASGCCIKYTINIFVTKITRKKTKVKQKKCVSLLLNYD